MRRQEEGFTLIELVMVIVILGILAAVAVPRYLDLTTESQTATKNAGVSSAGSAVAIAAARNRAAAAPTPTASMVLAELAGAECSAGLIIQGKVNVTLINANGANMTSCANTTAVGGVGTGVYST